MRPFRKSRLTALGTTTQGESAILHHPKSPGKLPETGRRHYQVIVADIPEVTFIDGAGEQLFEEVQGTAADCRHCARYVRWGAGIRLTVRLVKLPTETGTPQNEGTAHVTASRDYCSAAPAQNSRRSMNCI